MLSVRCTGKKVPLLDRTRTHIQFKNQRLTQIGGITLLLIAFLALFIFLFFQFRASTLQSVITANESFGNYVDSVLTLSNTNVRTSAMQVFYTSSIRKLRTDSELTVAERTIGHRDLGNFVSSSNFIENIMIYNKNMDMVFTSESGHSSAPTEEFHDQEAASLLRLSPQQSYLKPFRRQSGDAWYYSFLFFSDAPAGYSSMLLDINADWYETHLLGRLSQERHIIVDENGEPVIMRENTVKLPEWRLFQAAFAVAPKSGYVLSDNSIFLSSCWVYHKLGDTEWYFLELFDLQTDVPGLARIQRVFFAVFALSCIAILAMFIYLIFSVLPPLFHISRALTDVGLEDKNISEKIEELLSSHTAYQAARRLQELQSGELPEGMPLPVAFLVTATSGEEIAAAVCKADLTTEMILAHSEANDVVILPGCTNKKRNLILNTLRDHSFPSPVFFSTPCYTGEQLLTAFGSLEELRQLAFLYPYSSILLQEILSECNPNSSLEKKAVSSIESSLKKGQLDVAQAEWLLLFNSIRRDRAKAFYFAIHYLDRMLSNLEEELDIRLSAPFDDRFHSIQELHNCMDDRFRSITNAVNAQQQQAAESLSKQVSEIIFTTYHDENCCVQMIADQLDISPNYLNRQFRAATGISVGDAIQNVRIDKVCSLLRHSDLSVEQIARQVGISNTKYLFVLFKKRLGMTPAQFRESVK